MATTAQGHTSVAPAIRAAAENYTALNDLIGTNKELVMQNLVETYGDQGITGMLKMTGAISSGGSADQVEWFEASRRHKVIPFTNITESNDVLSFTITATNINKYDVFMDANTGVRYIAQSASTSTTLTAVPLSDGAIADPSDDSGDLIMLGNMYPQGSDQPSYFVESEVTRKKNPFAIVKGRHQVNGSQATNIGWVDVGGGDYRWFMYAEQEARKRFEDQREMIMLFGQQNDGDANAAAALDPNLAGSDGYVTAVEAGGITVSNANANPLDSFAEFDDLILELDKQGAPSEYAMYLNRKQDLAIDDMLASGISTGVTAGLAGQFGAFNNDADMAVKLGFKSFTRGGYTFHKHDWKLLNDPTLLGASNFLQGAMVPLSNVVDARTGVKAPALSMYYKEANGYSREMEHWVSGGGVLGHTNNGDAGTDVATFHYRSEIALVTRAANQHVIIKG
tara:strand:+ start:257 stop:1612 length:1356 start_codon:yes stop_codon:yes gene_type:complete